MKNSPSAILQELFIANAVFGDPLAPSPSWPIYTDFLPDLEVTPDSAASINNTVGVKDGRLMQPAPESTIFHYGLQLRVRAQDGDVSWAQCELGRQFCEQVHGQVVTLGTNAYEVENVSPQGPTLCLGIEQGTKRRIHHTVNFLATIVPSAAPPSPIIPVAPSRVGYLTNGVPFTLQTVPLPVGTMQGGAISFVIVCTDGANNEVFSGRLTWAVQNKAGVITGNVQVMAENPALINTAGTLEIDGQLDTSVANQVGIQIVVTSSLTPIMFQVYY